MQNHKRLVSASRKSKPIWSEHQSVEANVEEKGHSAMLCYVSAQWPLIRSGFLYTDLSSSFYSYFAHAEHSVCDAYKRRMQAVTF